MAPAPAPVAWSPGEKQVHRDLERVWPPPGHPGRDRLRLRGTRHQRHHHRHPARADDLILHDILAHNRSSRAPCLPALRIAPLPITTGRPLEHPVVRSAPPLSPRADRHRGRVQHGWRLPRTATLPGTPGKSTNACFWSMKRIRWHPWGDRPGLCEHWGVPAPMSTCGWHGSPSRLPSCGGYIAGSTELVEVPSSTHRPRRFVYSVGLSLAQRRCGLVATDDPPARAVARGPAARVGDAVLKLARERGLDTFSGRDRPWSAVIVGSPGQGLAALCSAPCSTARINVHPILPPAVARRSARLRFFINHDHSEAQIRTTVSAVADELAKLQRNRNVSADS